MERTLQNIFPTYTVNRGEFRLRGEFGHCKLFESNANNLPHIIQIM